MVNEIIIGIIKRLVELGRYQMLYDVDDNPWAGYKTRDYIDKLGLPADVVVEKVTKTLSVANSCPVDEDDNDKYREINKGKIYKFRTQCFGDKLYVKYKLLEEPEFQILIFSIHPLEYD